MNLVQLLSKFKHLNGQIFDKLSLDQKGWIQSFNIILLIFRKSYVGFTTVIVEDFCFLEF